MYYDRKTKALKLLFKDNVGKNLKANDRKFVVKFRLVWTKRMQKIMLRSNI